MSAARRPGSIFGRKLWGAFSAVLALVHGATADLVVVQKIEGGGQSGEQTLRIKDDRARCDVGTAISLLVDRQSGETTTLSHAQKGYVTLSPERAAAMLEQMKKARGTDTPPTLVATGRKEKIGDHECEIFNAELGTVKVTYWLARDYPNHAALLAQMDVVESNPLSGASAGVAPRTRDLPGMPLRIVMEKGGEKITVTLVSAKEEAIDPAIFQIPAGYREMPPVSLQKP